MGFAAGLMSFTHGYRAVQAPVHSKEAMGSMNRALRVSSALYLVRREHVELTRRHAHGPSAVMPTSIREMVTWAIEHARACERADTGNSFGSLSRRHDHALDGAPAMARPLTRHAASELRGNRFGDAVVAAARITDAANACSAARACYLACSRVILDEDRPHVRAVSAPSVVCPRV